MEKIENLITSALNARQKAYTPYSNFKVGAAILTADNSIYEGFNIECAAYSVCNCAERTALFRALYDGHRNIKAICVVGGKENEEIKDFCPPCGVCRQALREFCNPEEFKVILATNTKNYKIFTLAQLLPESFGPNNL